MMEAPISQMSGLAKLDSASLMAASGWLVVTPVSATSMMAIMDSAPIGMALPMMAAITPVNMASRCHACGVTPAGTGTRNQMANASPTAMLIGTGLKPNGDGLALATSFVVISRFLSKFLSKVQPRKCMKLRPLCGLERQIERRSIRHRRPFAILTMLQL